MYDRPLEDATMNERESRVDFVMDVGLLDDGEACVEG